MQSRSTSTTSLCQYHVGIKGLADLMRSSASWLLQGAAQARGEPVSALPEHDTSQISHIPTPNEAGQHLKAALGLVLDVLDLLAPRAHHKLDLLVGHHHDGIRLLLLITVLQNG